ncbi:MAG: QueT transporter family protein [Synergistaceae bacterium]|nr:QueT transporter family protein [Synergistaceae bacterium]
MSGLVAAVYAVATILFAPLSFGYVQIRVSEALTVLPFILPQAVFGLFIGCLFANLLCGLGLIDVLLGSGSTLIAAIISSAMPSAWLAALPPVIVNSLVVGGYLSFIMGAPFIICAGHVALGQTVACFLLGVPLTKVLRSRIERGGDDPAL